MERIVIVAYKPFPGREAALEALVSAHWEVLNAEGLVSDRPTVIAKAQNGAIVEVFAWKSAEAIEAAHINHAVQEMWGKFAAVCEYVPVGDLAEARQVFSEFSPIN